MGFVVWPICTDCGWRRLARRSNQPVRGPFRLVARGRVVRVDRQFPALPSFRQNCLDCRYDPPRTVPFDRMGYAAYRITLMVLASGVIVGLFAALRSVIGEEWALRVGWRWTNSSWTIMPYEVVPETVVYAGRILWTPGRSWSKFIDLCSRLRITEPGPTDSHPSHHPVSFPS